MSLNRFVCIFCLKTNLNSIAVLSLAESFRHYAVQVIVFGGWEDTPDSILLTRTA